MATLPETGYVRLKQILGDRKAKPPIPAILPISKTTFYVGIASGKYPAPSKKFGPRISVWSVRAIRLLIDDEA